MKAWVYLTVHMVLIYIDASRWAQLALRQKLEAWVSSQIIRYLKSFHLGWFLVILCNIYVYYIYVICIYNIYIYGICWSTKNEYSVFSMIRNEYLMPASLQRPQYLEFLCRFLARKAIWTVSHISESILTLFVVCLMYVWVMYSKVMLEIF